MMRILFAALAFAFGAQAAAQPLYKCKNAAGKLTYAGQECAELGLSPAGEVKGEASVAPAFRSSPPPAAPRARPASPAAQGAAGKEDAPKEERRCFTVKTAKGFATRCNDAPEEN